MSSNKHDTNSTPYTTYGAHSATNASYTAIKACDHAPKPVKVGDVEIYGCAQRDVGMAVHQGFDVISPLTQSCSTEFNGFYGLLLWFPIPDMTAPEPQRLRVHAQRLIDLARAGNRVVTFCIGSHGRTGTMLATCIGLLEPDVDPIDAVRARHCKDAVETYKQIEAVFMACGREVPEKWKESTHFKKYQPQWVQNGLTWSPASKEVTNDIVSNDKETCNLCNEIGGLGRDKLHWFGTIRSHADCYELAAKRAKEKLATSTPTSSKTPSADSPPVSDAQKNALSIGGYAIEKDDEDDGTPVIGGGENVVDRPFFDRWTAKQQRKYKPAKNSKDQFGDLKCATCGYLITDPYQAQKFDNIAFHRNCTMAQKLFDNVPLCAVCDDAYTVPPNDYCVDCQDALDQVDIELTPEKDKV